VSSYSWQEVIVKVVFTGQSDRQQVRQALKGALAQKRLLNDSGVGGLARQHPRRNLQSSPVGIQDGDCAIVTLRAANDLQTRAVQRVEWIQHLHMRRFRTQGIVSASATIRTYTA
jgi:hypothetical protein